MPPGWVLTGEMLDTLAACFWSDLIILLDGWQVFGQRGKRYPENDRTLRFHALTVRRSVTAAVQMLSCNTIIFSLKFRTDCQCFPRSSRGSTGDAWRQHPLLLLLLCSFIKGSYTCAAPANAPCCPCGEFGGRVAEWENVRCSVASNFVGAHRACKYSQIDSKDVIFKWSALRFSSNGPAVTKTAWNTSSWVTGHLSSLCVWQKKGMTYMWMKAGLYGIDVKYTWAQRAGAKWEKELGWTAMRILVFTFLNHILKPGQVGNHWSLPVWIIQLLKCNG